MVASERSQSESLPTIGLQLPGILEKAKLQRVKRPVSGGPGKWGAAG